MAAFQEGVDGRGDDNNWGGRQGDKYRQKGRLAQQVCCDPIQIKTAGIKTKTYCMEIVRNIR
ncbi:hypothetical protein CEK28_01480 [Xenophilus sp. AP218F]|nr:hypothetical protein [Chromobacterium sp. ASV5]OWY40970.1 hypothetical protein CEK28_01480 [Xenophilus sp. AP218F]